MSSAAGDPYAVLGVDPAASDADVRAAYRRLVKRYHPDHNGGSEESERRFEEVQEAYARARELRAAGAPHGGASRGGAPRGSAGPRAADDLDSRLADMERELHRAKQAREQAERAREDAIRAAREAASAASGARNGPDRASDEELGYFSTDDTFSKIFSDARDAIAGHLDDLADRLKREPDDD